MTDNPDEPTAETTEVAAHFIPTVQGAAAYPQAADPAPVASVSPVLWGSQLTPPDFANASKDDVVNAYSVLIAQYNTLSSQYSTFVSLAQNKDWGYVNDERKNQLESALTQIGAILLNASPTQAVYVAGQIVGIIQQVMPGVLPTASGTPLAPP